MARMALMAQTAVVQMLIENAADIGVVSDDLQDRVALMTECFSDSTVDECGGLELTENREKKRSGSLQGKFYVDVFFKHLSYPKVNLLLEFVHFR